MATLKKMNYNVRAVLAKVRDNRAAAIKRHERAIERYEKDCRAVGPKLAAELRAAADRCEQGELPSIGTNYRNRKETQQTIAEVPIKVKVPEPPPKKADTSTFDRLISALNNTSDETVSLETHEAEVIFGHKDDE